MESVQISIVYARQGTNCSQCVCPVSRPLSWVRSSQTFLCWSQTVSSPSSPVVLQLYYSAAREMWLERGLHFARIRTSIRLDLYSGNARFVRISVGTLAILISFVVFFSPSVLRLDHDHFQIIVHETSHHSTLYSGY
jgi:hypothetical protein